MGSKVLGSTLIIAGTTIGAGMLALPLVSAGVGFTMSVAIMIGLWSVMLFTALLMVELHQFLPKEATLRTLAHEVLGYKGKWVANFAMMFLFYALCAAYIAGGSAQFSQRVEPLLGFSLDAWLSTTMFTVVVAAIVVIGTSTVDKVNRVLFTLKLVAMTSALFFLTPSISGGYLLSMPLEQGLLIAAIPVIFTSFGFHGSIPAIVRYLDGDTPSLKKAIVAGSFIPLIVYLFWQLVTLGVVPQSDLANSSGLAGLIAQLSNTVANSHLKHLISTFADLALLTSFLGVSLGLFEFLGDNKTLRNQRALTGVMTFLPPLLFALFYPEGFIMALGYAAIALVVLAILLPVTMVYKVRKTREYNDAYRVKGGAVTLVSAGAIGVMIVITQVAISVGVLPSLG